MTSVCTPKPSHHHTQTQYTASDCVSVNDMHLKVLVLRRRCLADGGVAKFCRTGNADAPVLSQPSHLLSVSLLKKRSLSCPSQDLQATGKMGNMATEIVAFVLTISGWILVSSTLRLDYWKVSSVDGTVITTATFWSNLWKTCVTDSTGVSNCKDFPSMLALDGELRDDWGCCCCSSVWCCLSEVRQQRYMYLCVCFWGTVHLQLSIWPKRWCQKHLLFLDECVFYSLLMC